MTTWQFLAAKETKDSARDGAKTTGWHGAAACTGAFGRNARCDAALAQESRHFARAGGRASGFAAYARAMNGCRGAPPGVIRLPPQHGGGDLRGPPRRRLRRGGSRRWPSGGARAAAPRAGTCSAAACGPPGECRVEPLRAQPEIPRERLRQRRKALHWRHRRQDRVPDPEARGEQPDEPACCACQRPGGTPSVTSLTPSDVTATSAARPARRRASRPAPAWSGRCARAASSSRDGGRERARQLPGQRVALRRDADARGGRIADHQHAQRGRRPPRRRVGRRPRAAAA